MRSMSICKGPDGSGLIAGAAAAADPPGACTLPAGSGIPSTGLAGAGASGSRMSAPSPRPSAFLGIGNYLLSKLRIPLRPFAMNIVENNRLTETRRLCQAHISRDQTRENLRPKKASQVGRDLSRQGCAFIVHREKDALDLQAWIQRPANAHQRVQQFGNAFQCQ